MSSRPQAHGRARVLHRDADHRVAVQPAEESETATLADANAPTWDFSKLALDLPAHARLQPKLAINQPGDAFEQEADATAERVMRMPAPTLQRCACGGGGYGAAIGKQAPAGTDGRLQTKRVGPGPAGAAAPPIVHEALRAPGQALDPAAREFMEARFGHDFGDVRIHAGGRARAAADAVDALAFTVGRHIVFGEGSASLGSTAGRRLLAHELTHVVQQRAAPPRLQREPKKDKPPPQPPAGGNVLYIGMNNFALELAALDKLYKDKPVTVTRVTLATDEAHTESGGKTFDLSDNPGIDAFVGSLGLDKKRAASAGDLIKNSLPANRDDMAHVMAVYALTNADGKDRMSRVVLSGHSFGLDIMDTPMKNHIQFDFLLGLAAIFPKAAAQTKHVYVSACYAGAEDNIHQFFIKAYPNLVTFSGWTDQCPTNRGGAAALAEWAKTTDADPTVLAKPPEGRSNWASGVYQGVESSSPADTMANLRADEARFGDYFNGIRVDADAHRGWLTTYYGQARTADLRTGSIKGADHDYAHVHAEQAVRLRYWGDFVGRFWRDHEPAIRAGYGKAAVPAFGKMTRKEALKAIDKFKDAAQGGDADKAEAARLLEGLRQLDEKILPA